MGSQSDWKTMENTAQILDDLKIKYESRIVSAHRTPDRLYEYAKTSRERGLKVIIAGAGGAAHLPGMTASMTTLPVLGVPVESRTLKGLDSPEKKCVGLCYSFERTSGISHPQILFSY